MIGALAGSAVARSAWRTARISRTFAAMSANPHFGLDRHSRTQAVQAGLIFVEADAHRKTLHHLHIVAAGVLRREQARHGPGGRWEAFDVAAKILTVRIDGNGGLLAGVNPAQLCFLEVCRDPEVIDLGDEEQLLAGLHVVPDL